MATPRRGSRSYRTELRAKQTAATRAAILEALLAELARGYDIGEELSVSRVAAVAGVSPRTVYHHFPDRAAQLAAISAHLDATLPAEPHPSSLAELPVHAARFAYQMLANPTRLRAEVVLRKHRRARDAAIQRSAAKQTDAATAKLVGAALAIVLSPEVLLLLDRHRLDPASGEATVTWMIQVLVDAARNGDLPASPLKRTRRM